MRPFILIALSLALWAAPATATADNRIEMDVLELHELPAQAVRRMEDARQREAARRRGPNEHPRPGAFVPEDSLGDRGLATPSAELFARDIDDDRGRGHDRHHDWDHGDRDHGGGGKDGGDGDH